MEEKERKKMVWWFGEYGAENKVDEYLATFPEMDGWLSKFAIGVLQWEIRGEIDVSNPDDVSLVRTILKVLAQSPAFDFYDETFNDSDPESVCEVLGIKPMSGRKETPVVSNYTVHKIKNFEDAESYRYAVSWCIVISINSYRAYTAEGNRFYFLENDGWIDVPCAPGEKFPCDNYGLSLIAVEMTPDNKVASITTRWNDCCPNGGKNLTEARLRELLGGKFNEMIEENPQPACQNESELKEMMEMQKALEAEWEKDMKEYFPDLYLRNVKGGSEDYEIL